MNIFVEFWGIGFRLRVFIIAYERDDRDFFLFSLFLKQREIRLHWFKHLAFDNSHYIDVRLAFFSLTNALHRRMIPADDNSWMSKPVITGRIFTHNFGRGRL